MSILCYQKDIINSQGVSKTLCNLSYTQEDRCWFYHCGHSECQNFLFTEGLLRDTNYFNCMLIVSLTFIITSQSILTSKHKLKIQRSLYDKTYNLHHNYTAFFFLCICLVSCDTQNFTQPLFTNNPCPV